VVGDVPGGLPRPPRLALGGGAAEALLLGAAAVEVEEAGEDLVADVVGPAVAPRLLAAATAPGPVLRVLLLVGEEEGTGRPDVGPAVSVEDRPVHRGMKLAEPEDVG